MQYYQQFIKLMAANRYRPANSQPARAMPIFRNRLWDVVAGEIG
jgi:hypothetical protein